MAVAMSDTTRRSTGRARKLTRSVTVGRWGITPRVPQADQKITAAMSAARVAAKGG